MKNAKPPQKASLQYMQQMQQSRASAAPYKLYAYEFTQALYSKGQV
jgi:hypothetical protein